MARVLTDAEISWATAVTGISIELTDSSPARPAKQAGASPPGPGGKPGLANNPTATGLPVITISPDSAPLDPAGHVDFSATADYPDGTSRIVTSEVQWSTSDGSVTIDANGRATARPVSVTATITATDPDTGASGTATVTVAPPMPVAPKAPVLTSVTVHYSVDALGYLQLSATGGYADGSSRDVTNSVAWQSSNPAVTIDAKHVAQASPAPATATIKATDPATGVNGTADVTVPLAEPDALVIGVTVFPENGLIDGGGQLPLTAQVEYGDGSTRNKTTAVRWQSSDPSISINEAGVATARPVTATATITATEPVSGKVGTTTLTVAPPKGSHVLRSIAIEPANSPIPGGGELQFHAVGKFDDGSSGDITSAVDWASSLAAVAIDAKGKATAQRVSGVATITATDRLSGKDAKIEVTIAPPQERRMQTKFGEFSYWSDAEAAVKSLLSAASDAYDVVEPMDEKLDQAYRDLVKINAKVGELKTIKQEIDQFTDATTKTRAQTAMGADINLESFTEDAQHAKDELENIAQDIAIDENEITVAKDEKLVAEYRKTAQEVDAMTHTILKLGTNIIKGALGDPMVVIDELADLLETVSKEENQWTKKADELERQAKELKLKDSRARHANAIDRYKKLTEFAKQKLGTVNKAKAHLDGKWHDAETRYDNNPKNTGGFRFKNLAEAIRLAKLVIGYADPTETAAGLARGAVAKFSKQINDSPSYWMVDPKEDRKVIGAMSDAIEQIAAKALSRLQTATTWLAEYQTIYSAAHQGMDHAPERGS
jgi:hypothetical protein